MIGLAMALMFAADDGCTRGGEYTPALCPTGLPRVAGVTIEESGITAYREADSPPCASFRPTVAQIERYFLKARKTDPASADATIVNSPCQASGSVRFADGRSGKWYIERAGFGRLTLGDGTEMLLFCRSCRKAPFLQ